MDSNILYIPDRIFRFFSLFKQILSHCRITVLPLDISFAKEMIEEVKIMYQVLVNSISALFNSGSGSLKAIWGAWTFGPMLLLALFAIITNQGINMLRHFSMISLIGFTFACFNPFLNVSNWMLLIQIATIGFYFMMAKLSSKRNCRLILDVIFSGLSLLFMIYMDQATFAAVAFMVVGGIGMGVIALYIFFALFTCCYKQCCCFHFKYPDEDAKPDDIIRKVNQTGMTLTFYDVRDLLSQQTHYFWWTMLTLGCAFCIVAGVIVFIIYLTDPSGGKDSLLFVYILIPLGVVLYAIFGAIHYGDRCCTKDAYNKTAKRRAMLTRYTIKLVYLILDFLNVPLMKSVIDAFYDKTIQTSAIAQFGIISCFMQFIAIPLIYVFSIKETILTLDILQARSDLSVEFQWMKNCENIPSSTIANFEIYQYKYRYWFFLSIGYDLVNSILSVIYDREPKVYYAVFILHIAMLIVYCIFRPSFYMVHNVVNITSYIASIIEDINIILEINNKPTLIQYMPYILATMFIPVGSFVLTVFIKFGADCCSKDKTKLDDSEKEHYRCIGILLDDKAVDMISMWALHCMGAGIGLIMISIPVDAKWDMGSIWTGFGVTESILFCVGWVYSLKRTSLKHIDTEGLYLKNPDEQIVSKRVNSNKIEDLDEDSTDAQVIAQNYSNRHTIVI